MKILVACEFSGVVRDAFLARGHSAISCDLLPTEREGPHYQGDIFDIIDNGFDMMVAFVPCTHLACSGAAHFAAKRLDGRQQGAIEFFTKVHNANIPKICIENPVGIMSSVLRKPDQIIQPYFFGEPFEKTTCLWLKGLPLLTKTNEVTPPPRQKIKGGKSMPEWYSNAPKKDRAKIRSKTFQGVADAMAEQWG